MAPARAISIARRRPKRSETSPKTTPPMIAPTIEIADRIARGSGPMCHARCREVGYMSWVPCKVASTDEGIRSACSPAFRAA